MSAGQSSSPDATMEPACIGPLLQQAQLVDCWITDDGESIWLWGSDLALVLTLDLSSRCPTCGQHISGGERWHLTRADVLARRLFEEGYR